jgi:hypothetical protein
MPKGIPKKGYRLMRGKRVYISPNKRSVPTSYQIARNETDDEISHRIRTRFRILEALVNQTATGHCRALIVSGPPGLGKSHTVETTLGRLDPDGIRHTIIKGFSRATGLYKQLYAHRLPNQILVMDDADSIYSDDVSLNLLKAACDTGESRSLAWLSERPLIDDETSERIPSRFKFEGSVIFVTNIDFEAVTSSKLAPHLAALQDRAHYLDLTIKTKRDFLIRIKQVIETGLLRKFGLSAVEQQEVFNFLVHNLANIPHVSLRTVLKIATHRRAHTSDWQDYAKITICRQ